MGDSDLKKAGLKATVPRTQILNVIETSEEHHLSAEDIFRILVNAGDEIALGTIYRALSQFEAAGLVVRHSFNGGPSVFELAPQSHHDHMVCVDTGEVLEFSDEFIEKRQAEVAARLGYEITDHSLVLYVRKKKR
ncbi:MAG: ferric iron uptake transcriptional regulator [Pseudomonadota bacterium]